MAAPRESSNILDHYELGEKLGYGAFSFARKAYDTNNDRHVAIKFTKHSTGGTRAQQRQIDEIQTELSILSQVDHPNVLRLFEYETDCVYTSEDGSTMHTYAMALELCEGGELFDLLYYTGKFEEKLARGFFREIISGVKACHDQQIAHRDIKAQNVLLGENFVVKLADFGSSKMWEADQLMATNRVGTKGYQAPELLLKRGYTFKCDIFACGVLLFIALTRQPPFKEAVATDSWFREIAKGRPERFWNKHSTVNLTDDCKDLLMRMMCYQPLNRATIEEIEAHPWYTNDDVYTREELVPHLRERRQKAYQARRDDPNRNYDQYNSIQGVAGRGDIVDPPLLPGNLKFFAFAVPDHPFKYLKHLNDTAVARDDSTNFDEPALKCTIICQGELPQELLAEEEEPSLLKTKLEFRGYKEGEGEDNTQFFVVGKKVPFLADENEEQVPDDIRFSSKKMDVYLDYVMQEIEHLGFQTEED